ncbi:MAG: hypothetical protein ACKVE4_07015 [Dissulfuribacterales bacterium]
MAGAALDFDLEAAAAKKRIPAGERDKRDLMLYLLWETGGMTNRDRVLFWPAIFLGKPAGEQNRGTSRAGERIDGYVYGFEITNQGLTPSL